MKHQLKSWVITFTIVVISALGTHACSDENVAAFLTLLNEAEVIDLGQFT